MKDSRRDKETERLPTRDFANRLYSHPVAETQWWLAWEGRKREVTNKCSNMMQLVLNKTSCLSKDL